MELVIVLFFIGGIGLITWSLYAQTSAKIPRVKLPEETQSVKRIRLRSYLDLVFPFSKKMLDKLNWAEGMKRRLDAAHVRLTPAEFFNLKLLLIIISSVIAGICMGKVDAIGLVAGFLVGFVVPDIYLARRTAKRKYAIARLVPETVDLLGLCVEAGLDFTSAVRWIIEKVPINPLIEEFAFVLEEIKWGKSRTQALRDMSRRLSIPEISSFVQTLVQAERMGTPVAEAFAILSEDTRLQRFHRGERIAMQAPIKILIPLIFCILPVIGIIIGGPILLQFMQGDVFRGLGK